MTELTQKEKTQEFITAIGGPRALARLFKDEYPEDYVSSQAISQWIAIPPWRAIQIEVMTNGLFTRQELRPDIFYGGPAKKTISR